MIVDTDVLIDIHRGHAAARAWLTSLPEIPKVAGLAAMELAEGALNRRDMHLIQRFLTLFTLGWPTEADVMTALTVYQPLRLAHGTGLIDCLIAATGLAQLTGRGILSFAPGAKSG